MLIRDYRRYKASINQRVRMTTLRETCQTCLRKNGDQLQIFCRNKVPIDIVLHLYAM